MHILRFKLEAHCGPKLVDAEVPEILVEIAKLRHQGPRVDAGGVRALGQGFQGGVAGRIVVACHVEPAKVGGKENGGKMTG